uniref:Uncharacterized protein n=1 Tax=Nothoprocta perdicaria TaxID=30464 RepID=A0A8C6ZLB7_NOTPE
ATCPRGLRRAARARGPAAAPAASSPRPGGKSELPPLPRQLTCGRSTRPWRSWAPTSW